ncbi:MAG TPA: hypothetical protein VHC22_12360 [Pirellulales bacterium]|nr:hypothetical protein [Pirellulales bacterium]
MQGKNRITGLGQFLASSPPDIPIGYLVSSLGVRIGIKDFSINTQGDWWGGSVSLVRGEEIEPGTFRLVLNDGRSAEVSIDEVRFNSGLLFRRMRAAFHGIGAPP